MSSAPEAKASRPPAWRQRARRRFSAWVGRRIPPARSVTLDQKRIFILPSRVGVFFSLCLLVMLLTAINYQNNLGYALTFLLTTLFIVGILHTYANLAGLGLHALRARPAYPGQRTEFDLRLERGGRARYSLRLGWPGSGEQVVDLVEEDSEVLRVHCQVGERGWYHPGRLRVESNYPLGLLRCWTSVDLDLRALVYPRPEPSRVFPARSGGLPDGAALPVPGDDDFYGFRDYRPGDSLRGVHWKGHAKGQDLQVKQYAAYAGRSAWLDWDAYPGLPTERRLSHLCYWALECERRRRDFGLLLPGREISPGRGEEHLETVLTALALHGLGEGT